MADTSPLLLSVIIPCYNEAATLEALVAQVMALPLPMELIIVDDGSADGSADIIRRLDEEYPAVRGLYHGENQGKGAALATGFAAAQGIYAIVQDADLEYNPQEIPRLLAAALSNDADVVYGSRFVGSGAHRVVYFWHSVANRWLTTFSNITTNVNLTDMETCYKLFRREVIQSIDIQEKRFGVEPEITAKVARMGCRMYEVGISYAGRTYEEGKKIGWKDGLRALYCIARYGVEAPLTRPPVAPLPAEYVRLGDALKSQHEGAVEKQFWEQWENLFDKKAARNIDGEKSPRKKSPKKRAASRK
jgi:glycosyltransferase involved in cell wall biosynthesis